MSQAALSLTLSVILWLSAFLLNADIRPGDADRFDGTRSDVVSDVFVSRLAELSSPMQPNTSPKMRRTAVA